MQDFIYFYLQIVVTLVSSAFLMRGVVLGSGSTLMPLEEKEAKGCKMKNM